MAKNMSRVKLLLADTDERYLMPLENKFIDGLQDSADINVITDTDYLESFFSVPQSLDILVISEHLYNASFDRHNITSVFVLTDEEEASGGATGNLDINQIPKYSSVNEIYTQIMGHYNAMNNFASKDITGTCMVMVYSPIGGMGTTTIATGLCAALSRHNQKVLYVGPDSLQRSGLFLRKPVFLKPGLEKSFYSQNEYLYDAVKPYIIYEDFYVLPPFSRPLPSLNIRQTDYAYLIQQIKESKDFDYIVVDCCTYFSEDTSNMMGDADHILIVTGQDRSSVYKLDCLVKNIDCSDPNRFLFVCNHFDEDRISYLEDQANLQNIKISQYIEEIPEAYKMNYRQIWEHRTFQKLALMFL